MPVNAIPDGCNTVNAYLVVKDPQKAISLYEKAFGGQAASCMTGPGGSIMHAEIRIGNSTIMLTQENPQWELKSPETLGGSPVSIHLYVEDCDSVFDRAVKAGFNPIFPVQDMFWGDRYGKVTDPFGFQWGIATHVEDVDEAEMTRRRDAWVAQMANAAECEGAGAKT